MPGYMYKASVIYALCTHTIRDGNFTLDSELSHVSDSLISV
jgi:hypothetical protein